MQSRDSAPGPSELFTEGEWAPVDLLELEEQVRRGQLPPSTRLRGGPWAPGVERALGELPQLAEAFDAPEARFAQHLREARPFPVTGTLTLGVLAAGLVQLGALLVLARVSGPEDPLGQGAIAVLTAFNHAATGHEPLVLDGRWWTPWASQFSHAGSMHLFPNLAVLGYAGFRVERALGPSGAAVVAASALLGGVLAVTVAQPLPVIGSSILGYGLWAAQITLGFRMGDAVPPGWRAYYGYGNVALFAVLLIGTLGTPGVSHWAHLGGFLGGAAAALAVHPPSLVPRAEAVPAARRLWAAALGLALLPSLLGPTLRQLPPLAWGLDQEIHLEEVGATLQIPTRLLPPGWEQGRDWRSSAYGMPAWTTSLSSEEFVFCGLVELDWTQVAEGDPLTGDRLAEFWGRVVGPDAQARALEPPPSRAPGWTGHAIEFLDAAGVPRYRLVEHHLLRGRLLNRLGYVVALDPSGRANPREALFTRVLGSAQVHEPPALAAARDRHARNPSSERARYELALALADAGDLSQADTLLGLVIDGDGPLAETAAVARAQLWALFPGAFAASPRPGWLEPWLESYPQARTLQRSGITWLAAVGRCPEARAFHEAFALARPDAVELLETAEAVMRCEGGTAP